MKQLKTSNLLLLIITIRQSYSIEGEFCVLFSLACSLGSLCTRYTLLAIKATLWQELIGPYDHHFNSNYLLIMMELKYFDSSFKLTSLMPNLTYIKSTEFNKFSLK